jgi:hypothetical protein
VLDNRWETLSPLPISVHGCGAAIVNSRLYLVGGRSSQKHEKRVWVSFNGIYDKVCFMAYILLTPLYFPAIRREAGLLERSDTDEELPGTCGSM